MRFHCMQGRNRESNAKKISSTGSVIKAFPPVCAILFCALLFTGPVLFAAPLATEKIDRHALVTRHNPHLEKMDPWAPLSVGNGQFCFTADITGLQTFSDHYFANGIPLETMARWAWHEDPNPHSYQLADANTDYTGGGKIQPYPTLGSSPAGKWLRENPHDMPLAQLGLSFTHADGRALALTDVEQMNQTLDMWSGVLTSRYSIDGQPVVVTTASFPAQGIDDTIAVRIESPLVASGKLGVRLAFPRGHDIKGISNPDLDWSRPASYSTTILSQNERRLTLVNARDAFHYTATLATSAASAALDMARTGPHAFRIAAASGEVLEFTLAFSPEVAVNASTPPSNDTPSAAAVFSASAAYWKAFWQSGAAVEFKGSTDARATELERRVILSQYLTAIQFGGNFPPQESGLTNSTWFGKHHTEMVWWHVAHFAQWGRGAFLANTLRWYQSALPVARAIAQSRGLQGARWPKMIGPNGRESPGGNPLIVWNQPHMIYLSELLYRNDPTPKTLALYRDLVFETAEGMASMLRWDEARDSYALGPPLWIAQEIYDQNTSKNPTYELSYWARGLEIAQQWRERLGLPRDLEWEKKRTHLPPLAQKEGKYVALESTPDTWDNIASRHDHPSFLMALGQLPGDGVDRTVMRRTLDAVLKEWDWEAKIWGWDYPMIAMTAARLNAPAQAVDILLKNGPHNAYTANGHNPQRPGLPVYLPGNGALLSAVALMAGGWDGAPAYDAPGFPQDGSWVVHAEGFHRLP